MSIAKESGRLAWLGATLGQQRRKIARLLNRMAAFGPRGSMTPAVFRKFLGMLEQVAEAREQEMHLLSRIEDIEQKHRFMRKTRKLKRARPRPASGLPADFDWKAYPGLKKPPQRGIMWLLAFWYLFLRQKSSQKKQGLTAD
ncbi:MAG TPA: hypothetical protein VMV79_00040 [Alphaproteobacteria bacterium]|nr:hypothetical protein [Alphaproteobacteria bacterium]